MKYLNANKVLPDFLVKELQNYVQGDYLYVPIEKDKHKNGENYQDAEMK